jgi:hypothetical protein
MRAEEVPPMLADGMLFWTHSLILLAPALQHWLGAKRKSS